MPDASSARAPAQRPVVLLVDDHEDTRQMYAELLGSFFEMHTAADAPSALRVAAERLPDIIVTDLTLPGMDGFELIHCLRQDGSFRDIPIISLSGHAGKEHEDRARAAGCTRVLQKPCLPDTLAEVIGDILSEPPIRSVTG
jgi:CheY-like chemotaxis protein